MFPLSRNFLKFAAASAIVALTAVSTPARADELVQQLGPVGPHEPIITMVGNKRVIAFYDPAMVAAMSGGDLETMPTRHANTAARFRVSLNPREVVRSTAPTTSRSL